MIEFEVKSKTQPIGEHKRQTQDVSRMPAMRLMA